MADSNYHFDRLEYDKLEVGGEFTLIYTPNKGGEDKKYHYKIQENEGGLYIEDSHTHNNYQIIRRIIKFNREKPSSPHNYGNAILIDAIFENVTFNARAEFGGAIFSGEADFLGAQFDGEADFRGAQFDCEANFRGAQFSGSAYFYSAQFDDEAYFSYVQFSGSAIFDKALFINKVDFGSAKFNSEATFEDASISFLVLNKVKVTSKTKFNLGSTHIKRIAFNDFYLKVKNASNREMLNVLKNLAILQNDSIKALEFHSLEMHRHYLDLSKDDYINKWILGFEKCMSNFGTNPLLALFWYGILGIVFYYIMLGLSGQEYSAESFILFISPLSYDLREIFDCDTIITLATGALFLLYKAFQITLIYEIIKSLRKYSRKL